MRAYSLCSFNGEHALWGLQQLHRFTTNLESFGSRFRTIVVLNPKITLFLFHQKGFIYPSVVCSVSVFAFLKFNTSTFGTIKVYEKYSELSICF